MIMLGCVVRIIILIFMIQQTLIPKSPNHQITKSLSKIKNKKQQQQQVEVEVEYSCGPPPAQLVCDLVGYQSINGGIATLQTCNHGATQV